MPEGCWLCPWFRPAEAGGTPACDKPDCPLGIRVGLGEKAWLSSPSAGPAFPTHGSRTSSRCRPGVCVNLRSGVQNPMQACSGDLSVENVGGGQCLCGASMSARGQVFCFSRLQSTAEPWEREGTPVRYGGVEGSQGRHQVGSGEGDWTVTGSGLSVLTSPVRQTGSRKGQAMRARVHLLQVSTGL